MGGLYRVQPGIPQSGYSAYVELNDETLICLSANDIRKHCIQKMIPKTNPKPIHISFVIDNEYSLGEFNLFFDKLVEATGRDFKINIYTSGRNFNLLMDAIDKNSSVDKCSVYIDDHDIRGILINSNLDFSKVSCDCHLSKRYIRNLDDSKFRQVCDLKKFVFDREEALKERRVIEKVWREIGGSNASINRLNSLSKAILVADYINKNISYANDGHRITGTHNGLNIHYVEEWAQRGLLTYKYKKGVCSGQADLASILLDNYLAKTDCRVVEGVYVPFKDRHAWLGIRGNDGYYGICLTLCKRFVDLSKVGYAEGTITLEYDHRDRNDYSVCVDEYVDVPNDIYNNYRSKIYDFLRNNSIDSGCPPLPPRRIVKPLPSRREPITLQKRNVKKKCPPPLPNRRIPKRNDDK